MPSKVVLTLVIALPLVPLALTLTAYFDLPCTNAPNCDARPATASLTDMFTVGASPWGTTIVS